MTDIVERLRERPSRHAAETEDQAKERRQREREEAADTIATLRADKERLVSFIAWLTYPSGWTAVIRGRKTPRGYASGCRATPNIAAAIDLIRAEVLEEAAFLRLERPS
jgi:hypothetical protein